MTNLPNYEKEHHRQFVQDMIEAGYEDRLRDYQGRFFYNGPAVTTSKSEGISQQDIIRATDLELQIDNMGLNWILYPRN